MKKKRKAVVVAELFFLLCLFLYLGLQKKETVILNADEMTLIRQQADGSTVEEESCYYDRSYEANDIYIQSPVCTLDAGVYQISLSLETNQDGYKGECVSHIFSVHEGYYETDSGRQRVCSENNYTYQVNVRRNGDEIVIRNQMNPDGLEPYLLLNEIQISYSRSGSMLFWGIRLFIGFMLLNLCLWLYSKRNDFGEKTKLAAAVLTGIWLLSSVVIFIPYLVRGHDIRFHLMRIEGLKDGLLSGVFPVKVQPTWLNGNGYPVSILYPDLFLYIPACLRIMGVSLQTAYKIYIMLVNGVTVVCSYWSFSRMSGRRAWGVLGSFIYTLSMYRLTNVYTRAAVGEYTAMVFMPLVLYAMWKIYQDVDLQEKSYQRNWILLVLSLTGIIQSHIISVEMTGIFILLVCLLFWRKTFEKKRFLVLCKSLAGTILLNLWFVVPFLDYYKEDLIVLSGKNGVPMIQDKGIYIPQLFSLVYHSMGNGGQAGMLQEMPMTVGIGGSLVLLVCFWEVVIKGRKLRKEIKLSLGLLVLSLFLSTIYFPYDFFVNNVPVVGMLLANIQFPFRFLAPASVFLAWLACLLAKEEKWKRCIPILCIAVALQAVLYVGGTLNETEIFEVKGNADVSSFDVSGAEYVPYGTNFEILDTQVLGEEGIFINRYDRKYNHINMELVNASSQDKILRLPLLYYRGYVAMDENTGLKLAMIKGDNNRGQITIPAGYSGEITVSFEEPWYWRGAEIISLVFLIWLIISSFLQSKYVPHKLIHGYVKGRKII